MKQKSDKPAVVIFGTSITSAYLSGGTMLFRSTVKAFLEKGWKVTFVEEDHKWLQNYTDFTLNHPSLSILCYGDRQELMEIYKHQRFLDDADLVLKFSGSSILHDRYIDEWLVYRRGNAKNQFLLIYIDVDAPMRLSYIVNHPQFYLHKLISSFDGIWIMLGGKRAISEYRSMGASKVWYTPVAIDEQVFYPTSLSAEYAVDLLFVGNPTFGREVGLQRLFFEVAKCCPQYRFLLTGADWKEMALPDNVNYLGYVPSKLLPDLYCSARLVLNVTREEMASYGYAASLRLFEAAACGACIVSDSWAGLEEIFLPGEEILIANDTDTIVNYLYEIGQERSQAIGKNARDRVERNHTADMRISEFLALISIE